ncbi:MAG TPA: hypothetical protein VGL38_14605 [bacterium]
MREQKWLMLSDGTKLIRKSGDQSSVPFYGCDDPPEWMTLSTDKNNFADSYNGTDYFADLHAASEVKFKAHWSFRKSMLPDPELVITLSKAIIEILALNKVSKLIVDHVGQKLADRAADDLAKFYDLVKIACLNLAKHAIPKNRPITYVLDVPGVPEVQFVATTSDPVPFLDAIYVPRLHECMSRASELARWLGAVKVQFLLSSDGKWDLNYLLTKDGAVVGTPASFERQVRKLEMLTRPLDYGQVSE